MDNAQSHGILQGKRGLIFGVSNEQSLAWYVAKQSYAEGAKLVLSNSPLGAKLGNIYELATQIKSEVIECEATDTTQIKDLLNATLETLGGKIDFILHAIAMSDNIRRHHQYDNLNYNYFLQTLDTSALSLHKILQTAKSLDAISEWGSIVSLSYIAAHRPVVGYVDMGDAKALLESITRSFGQVYGEFKHVRVNTVSQSPTITKSTSHFSEIDIMREYTNDLSPLGNADGQSCANVCVMLFSDYTRFITMQNIFNDGGFSSTGLTNTYKQSSRHNR